MAIPQFELRTISNNWKEWEKQQFLFLAVCGNHRKPGRRHVDQTLRYHEIKNFTMKYNMQNYDVDYIFGRTDFRRKLQKLLKKHKGRMYLRIIILGHGTKMQVEKAVLRALSTDIEPIPNSRVHDDVGKSINVVGPSSKGNMDVYFLYCGAKDGSPEKDLHRRYDPHYSSYNKPRGLLPKKEYFYLAKNGALTELAMDLTSSRQAAAAHCAHNRGESASRISNGTTVLYFRPRRPSMDLSTASPPHSPSQEEPPNPIGGPNVSLRSRGSESSLSRNNLELPIASGGAESLNPTPSCPTISGDPEETPDTQVHFLNACPSIHHGVTSSPAPRTRDILSEKLRTLREKNNRLEAEAMRSSRQERHLVASCESLTTAEVHQPPNAPTSSDSSHPPNASISFDSSPEAGARAVVTNYPSKLKSDSISEQKDGSESYVGDSGSRPQGEKFAREISDCADAVFASATAGELKRKKPKKGGLKSLFSCYSRSSSKRDV